MVKHCFTARCSGQTPGEAELHYLENAKNMAMYGVHMHEAVVSCSVFSNYHRLNELMT